MKRTPKLAARERPAPQIPRPTSVPRKTQAKMGLVRFENLSPNGCRWPEARDKDGAHLFCNRPRETRKVVYCRTHREMATAGKK